MFLRAHDRETRCWQGFHAMTPAKHREDARKKIKEKSKKD
jgi:hypothetical protein